MRRDERGGAAAADNEQSLPRDHQRVSGVGERAERVDLLIEILRLG
ncbi:MAG: hypothetical protein QOD98_1222 [Nocardioidaceae bacterium]|nr:hypothetical protein [Nocardioidaceae bacterium]